MADLAPRSQGTRATTTSPLTQIGGGTGLAPWLRQSSGAPITLRSRPMLGSGAAGEPAAPGSQQEILEEQEKLAEELRKESDAKIEEMHVGASTQPTAEQIAATMVYAPDNTAGEGGGSTVPPMSMGYSTMDPYGFGPDYSDWYDKTRGEGALAAEAKRYADLDAKNQLGSYESIYGEFPEDPAEQEVWFRRAGEGGARTVQEQDRIASNKDTELTESLIMSALAAGMGAAAGGAAAASMSTPIPTGIGGATFNATAPLLGTAGTVAGGLYSGGDLAAQQAFAQQLRYDPRETYVQRWERLQGQG